MKRLKDIARRLKFFSEWRLLSMLPAPRGTSGRPVRKVMIVPPDPWNLIGSRGDQAMIGAVVQTFQKALPDGVRFGIVVGTDRAEQGARAMGLEPLQVWRSFMSTTRAMLDYQPDATVIIGADCMDGHYNPKTSARLVATADLLARRGFPVAFTGFSFNDTPHPLALESFGRLSGQARINLRDPVSLQRFKANSSQPAHLVADVAFLLAPVVESAPAIAVKDWIAQRRSGGTQVLAFNVHPHLVKDGNAAGLQQLATASTTALARVLAETNLSFVLMAHDFRERDGDGRCLAPIHEALVAQGYGDRILYPTEPFRAPELKGLAGMMDGVVTGRMHLAIASLGMGVPIAAIEYQAKFGGLLQHFRYPADMLISAEEALDADNVYALLKRFHQSLDAMQKLSQEHLTEVKKMSFETLKPLLNV